MTDAATITPEIVALALTIDDFITDPALLGNHFTGPSWSMWRCVLKAAFALPMTEGEKDMFRSVADRDPPKRRVREFWGIIGRRGGKDAVGSAVSTYFAMDDYRGRLRPGERATCMSLACDRDQARIQVRYQQGYYAECPTLSDRVEDITADGVVLKGGLVESIVATNNFRSVRGRPCPIVVLGEVAFYRDENSASPDRELYNAILPSLATLNGMLWATSSPWKMSGLLYDKWKKYYGQDDDDVLVVRGTSRQFNPTLSQTMIDAALEEDYAAAAAEWLAEWRSDVSGFLDSNWIDRAATLETGELMPPKGCVPVGALDPSGGRRDYMAAAVAWVDGGRVVVGALRARKPPFDPASVTEEFSAMFRRYGLKRVTSDRYGAEWVSSAFAKCDITICPSEKSASDIFLEAEPLFAQGSIDISVDKQLLYQLRNLERRTVRGGRDVVDHPKGGHNDHAVVVCMAAWLARRAQRMSAPIAAPIIIRSNSRDIFSNYV